MSTNRSRELRSVNLPLYFSRIFRTRRVFEDVWAGRTRVLLCTESKLWFWGDDERWHVPPPLLLSMKRKSYNTRESYRPTPGRKRRWLLKGRGCSPPLHYPTLDLLPKLCRDFVLSDRTTGRILKDEGGLIYPGIIPGSYYSRPCVIPVSEPAGWFDWMRVSDEKCATMRKVRW